MAKAQWLEDREKAILRKGQLAGFGLSVHKLSNEDREYYAHTHRVDFGHEKADEMSKYIKAENMADAKSQALKVFREWLEQILHALDSLI